MTRVPAKTILIKTISPKTTPNENRGALNLSPETSQHAPKKMAKHHAGPMPRLEPHRPHSIDPTGMHPLMAAAAHNEACSPLTSLLDSILIRTIQAVDPVSSMCLRRTSRDFLRLFYDARPDIFGFDDPASKDGEFEGNADKIAVAKNDAARMTQVQRVIAPVTKAQRAKIPVPKSPQQHTRHKMDASPTRGTKASDSQRQRSDRKGQRDQKSLPTIAMAVSSQSAFRAGDVAVLVALVARWILRGLPASSTGARLVVPPRAC